MKINILCVRDLLYTLSDSDENLSFDDMCAELSAYSPEQVQNVSRLLADEGYIEWQSIYANGELVFAEYYSLTLSGLDLLKSLSDDTKLRQTLTIIGKGTAEVGVAFLKGALVRMLLP